MGPNPRGLQPVQGSGPTRVPSRYDLFKQPESGGCGYQNVKLRSGVVSDAVLAVSNAGGREIPKELHGGNEETDPEEERVAGVGAPEGRNPVLERECGSVLLGGYEASSQVREFRTGNGALEKDFVPGWN